MHRHTGSTAHTLLSLRVKYFTSLRARTVLQGPHLHVDVSIRRLRRCQLRRRAFITAEHRPYLAVRLNPIYRRNRIKGFTNKCAGCNCVQISYSNHISSQNVAQYCSTNFMVRQFLNNEFKHTCISFKSSHCTGRRVDLTSLIKFLNLTRSTN